MQVACFCKNERCNPLTKTRLVWHIKNNLISSKSLNNGTFSRFKRFLIKPGSRRLGGFLLCLRFFFFFVGEQTQTPTANCLPRMMSSSANHRPFLSSFRHISPSGGFCQVSELTVYTKKWRPSAMGVRTFARIKHLIWDQLLASKAEIIQS